MTPVTITVSGSSTAYHQPERAVLSFLIKHSAESEETVLENSNITTTLITGTLKDLSREQNYGSEIEPASVTMFSVGSIRIWWDMAGDPRRLAKAKQSTNQQVYHAQVKFEVCFKDFKALNNMLSSFSIDPSVEILRVEWRLAEETRRVMGSKVRRLAMEDAIRKADDYASAIGRKVTAFDIADPECPDDRAYVAAARMMSRGDGHDRLVLDLQPKTIEFNAAVKAVFKSE
ncbi:SIMPL domain-containing protein [Aspergillus clavatus NRRL 1]|uniref:SIMPL domain-containing protein n=1 Tax=Aspergillus clavatus (strain ATCC 1007 / CBS 513.65 / DSM 816 / NCTC 3887 / NRRL 1 / QM 1276 / 107) TaxID=344612 RepID=A1CHF2_ASPCL|nr:uncharacterized protein ACLA_047760 [Aspergillus clavatus NRRL 1]EAW10307.1 conserved hypothetical protein [Aspergillus clavatus NRRL 1]